MIMKIVEKAGQPLCAVLYVFCGYLSAKKKPLPLVLLFLLHTTEYFITGKKTAKENGLPVISGIAHCLLFGFTWWLPLKKNKH